MKKRGSTIQPNHAPDGPETLLASVVISTFNRCEALPPTLAALARQDIPPENYEVIVIDDGSTDATQDVLAAIHVPYALGVHHLPVNRGVSAGRNVGVLVARARNLILLSDDLVVSKNFIGEHVRTLETHPDAWVVGGFRQLPDLTATPFGRYLDSLERGFERGRTGRQIAPGLYEMDWPTARNMSLPRADVERVGLFDEQFRVTCEDQDLAQRARALGTRFLYNATIDCVHNDHAADLSRYCRFQERGAMDTVRLCRKYPAIHGQAAVAIENGPVRPSDGALLIAKKLLKSALVAARGAEFLGDLASLGERIGLPDRVLFRMYKTSTALAIFRGWRTGLSELGQIS